MDYRKIGSTYYVRMDRGDEIVSTLLSICEREGIASAIYSGIGGCQSAEIQTFVPAKGAFDTERVEALLELVSLTGNVISDRDGKLYHHTHALFAYVENGQHRVLGGHLKSSVVLYTGEIELRPVEGGRIGRKYSPETGTGFWDFEALP